MSTIDHPRVLSINLKGLAETYYFSLDPEIQGDFRALTEELSSKFGAKTNKWRLVQNLKTRYELPTESVTSYLTGMRSLLAQLKIPEDQQITTFVLSLREDPRIFVMGKAPTTLDSAEEAALLSESTFKVHVQNKSISSLTQDSKIDTLIEMMTKFMKLMPQDRLEQRQIIYMEDHPIKILEHLTVCQYVIIVENLATLNRIVEINNNITISRDPHSQIKGDLSSKDHLTAITNYQQQRPKTNDPKTISKQ